ncbi:hypothetical protein F5Y13DRAFT_158215 [Hypoxylon sp. FL1857]|nr:hypothetical protein F5Y13DRAFT_158215 [Hypoxylon sp. FL1857]
MADLQQPPLTKKKLPFKRTVRRKSSEVVDDDGLSLFSRSGEFFEEQKRRAQEKEKAAKAAKVAREAKAEQERKERIARERKAEEEALNRRAISDQDPAKKRRRISLSDNDHGDKDSDEEDVFGYKPPKKQKSPSIPRTPTSKRESSFGTSPRGSGARSIRSQTRNASTPVISLDDDDDDPVAQASPTKPSPAKRLSVRNAPKLGLRYKSLNEESKQDIITLDDDSDTQADTGEGRKEDEEEDPSEYYVRVAMERARKAKEEREAREKRGSSTAADEDDPVVQILINSHMQGIQTLMFRRKLSQKLTVVYQTWIEQQVAKHSLVPRPVLESMFFTWKGNKVYSHTTLRTLGIRQERDGSLYPAWKTDQEGYLGRDKVYFEAWTQELYDEYLEEKEKKRLREIGELVGEEPEGRQESEQPPNSPEDQKIRVHFKAKDRPATKATVRSSTTAAQLAKVYRRLADIPENKTIELRWDGEVLGPETTVEEADIEDMDSIEVHIK